MLEAESNMEKLTVQLDLTTINRPVYVPNLEHLLPK